MENNPKIKTHTKMQEGFGFKEVLFERLEAIKSLKHITLYILSPENLMYFKGSCQTHNTVFTEKRVRLEMKGLAREFNTLFEKKVKDHCEIDQFVFVETAIYAALYTEETWYTFKKLISFVVDIPEVLRTNLPQNLAGNFSAKRFSDDVAQIIDELGLTESCITSDLSCTNRDCIGVDVLKKKPA
jgi:hypothetical protein